MTEENKYIKVLESVKKRKGMYVAPEELDSVANFLSGFTCAAISQDSELQFPSELLSEIGAKRGWKKSACGPIYHIRQSNLNEDKKMNELIEIYIECFKVASISA
jgi:hypothetical protein